MTLESQTPVARLRHLRVLGVVRVGLHERADACCGWPGMPVRADGAHRHDPLVMIGGAVTFVNPEPLALFADVIAAGEGRGADSGAGATRSRRADRAAICCAACGASAASTSRRSTTCIRGRRHASTAFVPQAGHRRAAGRAEGGAEDDRGGRSAGDDASSRPTPSSARASSIEVVRGCANLCRFCWAGYNYLPVRAFPTDRILRARRAARAASRSAPGWCRSRCATTRRSSASSAACSTWATPSARRRCGSTT